MKIRIEIIFKTENEILMISFENFNRLKEKDIVFVDLLIMEQKQLYLLDLDHSLMILPLISLDDYFSGHVHLQIP